MADPARLAAAVAAVQLAARFPDLPLIEPETGRLSDADARLCTAIHRHSLQRWLTIEAVLQGALRQPVGKLDPVVRGVLINAGAQLLFMDRLPDYAVIDGAVALTRKLDRKRATGLVNTTLRKVAGLIVGRDDGPWTPAANALPWPGGGTPGSEGVAVVHLSRALLPKPDNLLAHLSVATSLPLALLQQWFKLFGREQATALAMQSLATPPTYVVEDESPRRWEGSHAELVDFLAAAPGRRVQDPASLASVAAAATAQIAPGRVLDLCAGRGTKSRQLAAVFPEAVVDAWDPDADRAADLSSAADTLANLNALDAPPQPLPEHGGGYGLVVLDVPCSNTGVLARRPGARYRATARGRDSLVALQQKIIATGLAQAAAGGHVLYCTCSIDPAENQDQTQWLLAQAGAEAEVVVQDTLLPLAGPEGHDGSYHALIRLGGR